MDTKHNYVIDYETIIGNSKQIRKKVNDGNKFLLDFCDVQKSDNSKRGCVYILGDFYIGYTSYHVGDRILQHVRQAINRSHKNKMLQEKILSLIANNTPFVAKVLSKNKLDEKILIGVYSEKYPMVNIMCNNI